MAKKKKVVVAAGVTVSRGKEEKMREKKGSSSAGKYKTVKPKEFAGAAGGASKYSFPINTKARARNALARAHFAPNPEGIKAKVYREYPALKKHKEMREHHSKHHAKKHEDGKKHHKHDPKHVVKKARKIVKKHDKVEKVMHEFKEHKLHSGSKKGPVVHNPKQAIAIALSEARRVGKKRHKK